MRTNQYPYMLIRANKHIVSVRKFMFMRQICK